mgnify:FL=1
MKQDAWKILASFACMLLGFAPLIYWGSESRYEEQVEAEVHRRMQAELDRGTESRAVRQADAALLFPITDKSPKDVISGFGDPRGNRLHQGIDIKADRGTPVLAIAYGVVKRVKNGGNGGRQIWLTLDNEMTVFYAHLHEQWVEEGEKVAAGQAIGSVGNTGNARNASPHLHFEIILPEKGEVDPLTFYGGP